jgi:hypothetical protein
MRYRDVCAKCDARRIDDDQIGLEETVEEYVENVVAVFRAVWRVLKPDGTVWLNIGSTYAAERNGSTPPAETLAAGLNGHGANGLIGGKKAAARLTPEQRRQGASKAVQARKGKLAQKIPRS